VHGHVHSNVRAPHSHRWTFNVEVWTLNGANFVRAVNYAIEPTSNTVRRARFSLPEAATLLEGFGIVIEW
jgi:hypothetical protein